MKRFRFRLDQVMRVRRLQEDQARAALLAANRGAHEAEARVEARLADYRTRGHAPGAQPYEQFERARFLLDGAAAAVGVARVRHREAVAVVDARRDDWSAARRRVAALERLEARRRAEHETEVRRAEDRFVDDLIVARHGRGRNHR